MAHLSNAYLAARKKMNSWNGEPDMDKRVPLTPLELDALFEEVIKDDEGLARKQGDFDHKTSRADITCYDCCAAHTCEYVCDLYNTGGDCLASK